MVTSDDYRAALSVDDLASIYFAKAILGEIGTALASSVVFPVPQHVIIDSMPAGGSTVDVTDRAGRLLGHVTVDNASIAVTFTAPQHVIIDSLPEVEIKNDSGNPVPVSGTVAVSNLPATQPVSGTVAVSNFPATQPVSGTVGVSGEVEVKNDSGNPIPVTGTVSVNLASTVLAQSTVNLAPGAVWDSGYFDLLAYSGISVGVRSSHASATDGLEVYYSLDGVTQDDNDLYTIPAANGQTLKFGQGFRYGGVRYTNGGTTTTTFRIQVIGHTTVQKSSTHRVADTVNTQQDTDLVTAVLKAINIATGLGTGLSSVALGSAEGLYVGAIPFDLAGNFADFAKGLKIKDDYQTCEYLAEQNGAGAVLTFTFTNAVDFVWVTDVGAVTTSISHVDAAGGTPTNTKGNPVFNQLPTPISVIPASTTVKVFAPTGTTINMAGYRRT